MKKLAFVTPWYGKNISGGAEAELRGLVRHLWEAGVDLEILTTCVRDFLSDWNINYHAEGLGCCDQIPVRRFPVRTRDVVTFDRLNAKLMRGNPILAEEEQIYQQEMINSPKLYRYIRERLDDYALFVFIPYMFGTTYYGIQECYEKAVIIPCLHDEAYAYMKIFKQVFSRVCGMIFHSEPERLLAEKLYRVKGKNFVNLGEGVDTELYYDAKRFRNKYKLHAPFILYAGRKEAGKNVGLLLQYFARWKKSNPSDVRLVLIGGGDIGIPASIQSSVHDLGFVSAQDKYDACAAAEFLCQPSQFESFSLVIMESWLCGRPVLVNETCAVTSHFVTTSNGGLYYKDYQDFEGCVNYLLNNSEKAFNMGIDGKQFVMENFSWEIIVQKYTQYFQRLSGAI